jgi:hypothetical protein
MSKLGIMKRRLQWRQQPVGSYTYGPPKGPFKKPRIWWSRRSVIWQHFWYRLHGMTRENQHDPRWDKLTGR